MVPLRSQNTPSNLRIGREKGLSWTRDAAARDGGVATLARVPALARAFALRGRAREQLQVQLRGHDRVRAEPEVSTRVLVSRLKRQLHTTRKRSRFHDPICLYE